MVVATVLPREAFWPDVLTDARGLVMDREPSNHLLRIAASIAFLGGIALLSLDVACSANDATVPRALRQPLRGLFEWPSPSLVREKGLSGDSLQVRSAKFVSDAWLRRAMNKSWLPPDGPKPLFLKQEVDDRDVVRSRWTKNGYHIQVAQTGTIFTIKVTPEDGADTGKDDNAKLEVARGLCLRVFADKGIHYGRQGVRLPINSLPQKIAAYSFSKQTTRRLQGDDDVLVGRPKTMEEEGITRPMTIRDDPSNPNWCNIPFAWEYWFRQVYWWNDGISVGFYLFKNEGGPQHAEEIGATADKGWFE
jgi:hypothetical protein